MNIKAQFDMGFQNCLYHQRNKVTIRINGGKLTAYRKKNHKRHTSEERQPSQKRHRCLFSFSVKIITKNNQSKMVVLMMIFYPAIEIPFPLIQG